MEVVPRELVQAALAGAAARNPLAALTVEGHGTAAAEFFADARRVASVVRAIGATAGAAEARVAGSLMVMGYTTRLFSPAIALALAHGIVLDVAPGNVLFSYDTATGMRLTLAEPTGWAAGPAACVEPLRSHTAALITAVRSATPVAAGLLWGNAASSAMGAVRGLVRSGRLPAAQAVTFAELFLRQGDFAGTGTLTGDGVGFLRRSCCLYYRLPRGGFCGDCPLPGRGESG